MTIRKCLKLDSNWDLALENNRIVFLTDLDCLKQQVIMTLKARLGEWLFDTGFGLDYFGKILVKNPDFGLIAAEVRAVCLSVDGIESVGAVQLDLDHTTREITINVELEPIGSLKTTIGG